MFLAPKEIKEPAGESLAYCPRRVMVSKEFTFDSAHHLFNYDGKCKAVHGHIYRLKIAVSGWFDERGNQLILEILSRFIKNIWSRIWTIVTLMKACLI